MKGFAHFRFYGSLHDFLSHEKGGIDIPYFFSATPSVKDAIESLGIPHTEIHTILINGSPVCFDYQIKKGDKIEVYPPREGIDKVCGDQFSCKKFVLDVHLGKLAKKLRMLGIDTYYANFCTTKDLLYISGEENRIILTRNIGLLKYKIVQCGYWLRSQHTEEQLKEVIRHFQLKDHFKPLSRCLVCNTSLAIVEKERIRNLLPPKTKLYFNEFYQCIHCRRIFWKGSHYESMEAFVNNLFAP